jgi:hypothetical protein
MVGHHPAYHLMSPLRFLLKFGWSRWFLIHILQVFLVPNMVYSMKTPSLNKYGWFDPHRNSMENYGD